MSVPAGSFPAVAAVAVGCPGIQALDPVCQLGGVASSIAGAGVGAVFGAVSGWVVSGAAWLLQQVDDALSASTAVDVGATWFTSHFERMAAVAAVVVLPLLLLAAMQAVLRQSAAMLLRSFLVQLPLAFLLTGAAVRLVQLAVSVTDALGARVTSGTDLAQVLAQVTTGLTASSANPAMPAFVLLLGGLLVALGSFALWLELVVRAASVYVAVLFLPLVLVAMVWPATAQWCRRLVDTLVALVLSKFVIVAILGLAAGAIVSGVSPGSGTPGFAAVLSGGALLLLAAYSPFTLLKLVPMVEAGAVHHLEAARHRMAAVAVAAPRSAAALALRHARAASFDAVVPGSGRSLSFEAPGGAGGPVGAGVGDAWGVAPGSFGESGEKSGTGAAATGAFGTDIPMWEGDPEATRAALERLSALAADGGARSGAASASGEEAPSPASGPPARTVARSRVVPLAPGVKPWRDGTHVIARDAMGPVIRWVPPDGPLPSGAGGPPPGGPGGSAPPGGRSGGEPAGEGTDG
ncbi:MAG TPA: hypothetical protein VKV36_01695 [Acidimicrobiales bacterium]|nr:hypothetical protein [Acidimicrobiales bacterium]